ncbi:hypothetical protein ECP029943810_5066 [Escherichia coli P0299438.10]|nr:hypothetical protein ECTX1999_2250 [Escherichia coli TX1999]EHV81468.1 hypothetical protein ECDEC7C_5391 [Escherichia coli DEC7C]EHV82535.1 hypothetical protein ECDEC7A_5327 [Escherichia coli DEC7A]EHX60439.1 hypothetical protein ECDEC13D_3760 [Escherichia coli DEC13D]EMU63974.1 hypothetical protein ECMP02155212_5160 [Escherichia coli MP021552.12]EMU70826.1 hypothetical protein ECMP0215527_5458 [Escherichia coli MP021552.7]EMU71010.1 hypothetical protein ECMP02155211_4900 [Escherichia coli
MILPPVGVALLRKNAGLKLPGNTGRAALSGLKSGLNR